MFKKFSLPYLIKCIERNFSIIAQNPEFCTKCVKDKKYKEYFQIQCTDFEKYMKCQSKCVSSKINGIKTPFECIRNPACAKKCESNCKKSWPGNYKQNAVKIYMNYNRTVNICS